MYIFVFVLDACLRPLLLLMFRGLCSLSLYTWLQTLDPKSIRPFAFVPFGAGPRRCLGEHLAYIEGKVVLAMLLQRFSFSLAKNQGDDVDMALTFRPAKGIHIHVRPRSDRVSTASSPSPASTLRKRK